MRTTLQAVGVGIGGEVVMKMDGERKCIEEFHGSSASKGVVPQTE